MTRISFYLVNGTEDQARLNIACRLIQKAYQQGHQIYVHTDNEQQTEHLNQLLWSFQADSFVPHERVSNDISGVQSCPILIGHDQSPPHLMAVLVNLASEQPIFFSQFERVLELINDDNQIKADGRARYRFYQQRGYDINTVKL